MPDTMTADLLAAYLQGENPQALPEMTEQLCDLIRNGTAHELALMLGETSGQELNALAIQAQGGDFPAREALKQLRDLQLNWISANPAKEGALIPIALTNLQSSAQMARIVKVAPDSMAIRLISDFITDLHSAPIEHVLALTRSAAPSTGDLNHDALLAAGTAWATRTHQLPTPQWTIHRTAPELLWKELSGRNQEQWIPEFKERNILPPLHSFLG